MVNRLLTRPLKTVIGDLDSKKLRFREVIEKGQEELRDHYNMQGGDVSNDQDFLTFIERFTELLNLFEARGHSVRMYRLWQRVLLEDVFVADNGGDVLSRKREILMRAVSRKEIGLEYVMGGRGYD